MRTGDKVKRHRLSRVGRALVTKRRGVIEAVVIAPQSLAVDVAPPLTHRPVAVEITPPIIAVGAGGGAAVMVVGEIPTGVIDGSNLLFITSYAFPGNQLWVYLNGLRQHTTNDYVILSDNSFQMVTAPLVGDFLTVDYVVQTP